MLVGYTAEEYVLRQSRNLIAGAHWKYNFIFLQFLQIKVSGKDESEDMHCNLQVGNVK